MNNYIIGGKEYTREELLEFGKKRYPKFYWIKRGIGIGLMAIFGISAISFLIIAISLYGHTEDPDDWLKIGEYVLRMSIISACVCGLLFLGALVLFIISFVEKNDEQYIKRAVNYYKRQAANEAYRKAEEVAKQEEDEINTLIKYKRQRDAGEISQEEYEAKKNELLK